MTRKSRQLSWPSIRLSTNGTLLLCTPAVQHGLTCALEFAERYTDPSTGDIQHEWLRQSYPHGTLRAALAYLLAVDKPRAMNYLRRPDVTDQLVNAPILVLMLHKLGPALDAELSSLLTNSLCRMQTEGCEDIIAGRNINIPMMTWTTRLAQSVLLNRPDLVQASIQALQKLTDLIAAHGSIPEFNCPSYDPVTLLSLRAIILLGEPESSKLAARLERHLWNELAWRYHPRLRVVAGPWARAYQSCFMGGSSLVQLMLHIAWDALFDPDVAYPCHTAHGNLHGSVFPLMLDGLPYNPSRIAMEKSFPLTILSASEQVSRKLGDEAHRTWVPGGIAELTTWMDENLAVGTASRSHLHGLQNATWLAQWSRTGNPVATPRDLGQAYARFTINGKRPFDDEYCYRNHQGGQDFTIDTCLWGDDGRPFAIQSGPTALLLYLPKPQERWYVQSMEMMVAIPWPETIGEVLVDGSPVDEWEGAPDASLVITSGHAALGLRFAVCDPTLVQPRLFIERQRNHLLAGLRLIRWEEPREIPVETYLRMGGSIGTELRYAPDASSINALVQDMRHASIADTWDMAAIGGPREVTFQLPGKRLYGRFDPIGETWLRRLAPPHSGRIKRIVLK